MYEVSYEPVTHSKHNPLRICSLRALSKVEVSRYKHEKFLILGKSLRGVRKDHAILSSAEPTRVAPPLPLPEGVSNKFDKRCAGRSSPKNAKRKNATRREKCSSTSFKSDSTSLGHHGDGIWQKMLHLVIDCPSNKREWTLEVA